LGRPRSELGEAQLNQQALVAGVEALGLKLLVENPKDRLGDRHCGHDSVRRQ